MAVNISNLLLRRFFLYRYTSINDGLFIDYAFNSEELSLFFLLNYAHFCKGGCQTEEK